MAETFETIQVAAQAREDKLNGHLRIRVGVALCGEAAGAFEVLEALKDEIRSRDYAASVQEVGCIGLCYAEPLVDVQLPNRTRIFFRNVTPEDLPAILEIVSSGDFTSSHQILGTLGDHTVPQV